MLRGYYSCLDPSVNNIYAQLHALMNEMKTTLKKKSGSILAMIYLVESSKHKWTSIWKIDEMHKNFSMMNVNQGMMTM